MFDSIFSFLTHSLNLLKISLHKIYGISDILFRVMAYFNSFIIWLFQEDTLETYTIPKVNELCREKLIMVILDYESLYLGLVGDVSYSEEVGFLRCLVCHPLIAIFGVLVWMIESLLELLKISLWISKTLVQFIVSKTFLRDIYLYFPMEWLPLIWTINLLKGQSPES